MASRVATINVIPSTDDTWAVTPASEEDDPIFFEDKADAVMVAKATAILRNSKVVVYNRQREIESITQSVEMISQRMLEPFHAELRAASKAVFEANARSLRSLTDKMLEPLYAELRTVSEAILEANAQSLRSLTDKMLEPINAQLRAMSDSILAANAPSLQPLTDKMLEPINAQLRAMLDSILEANAPSLQSLTDKMLEPINAQLRAMSDSILAANTPSLRLLTDPFARLAAELEYTIHVGPVENHWQVTAFTGSDENQFPTKAEAVQYAYQHALEHGYIIYIYDEDGLQVQTIDPEDDLELSDATKQALQALRDGTADYITMDELITELGLENDIQPQS